jgi:hypothetical protein
MNRTLNIVLVNPPFREKSSVTIVNEAGESSKESLIINRDDFCHRSLQNQPVGVESKPATLRSEVHIISGFSIKGFFD